MTFYISKEFILGDFEAWSGGLTNYKKLEELDIIEEAEEYIMEHLANQDIITETDVNDFLWFDMDDFIQEAEEKAGSELLEYYLENGLDRGYLYAINSWLDDLELSNNDNGSDYAIRYKIKDDNDIYIVDSTLYIVNRELKQVSLYKVVEGQVKYVDYEAL